MKAAGRTIFVIGVLSVLTGLLQILPATVAGITVEAAFYTSTGLAMIVLAWLREGRGRGSAPADEESAKTESFASRYGGYLILGGLVFAGLALISAPIIAVLMKFMVDEGVELGEEATAAFDSIRALGQSSGPSYYAFLLGLVYFLSSKKSAP